MIAVASTSASAAACSNCSSVVNLPLPAAAISDVKIASSSADAAASQGLTLVYIRAQLEQVQDIIHDALWAIRWTEELKLI
jgi:hypothetical protein